MDCGIDTSLAGGNSHYYTMRDAVWQWHRERAEMMAENTKGNRR